MVYYSLSYRCLVLVLYSKLKAYSCDERVYEKVLNLLWLKVYRLRSPCNRFMLFSDINKSWFRSALIFLSFYWIYLCYVVSLNTYYSWLSLKSLHLCYSYLKFVFVFLYQLRFLLVLRLNHAPFLLTELLSLFL